MNIRWLDSAEDDLKSIVRLESRLFGLDVATQVFDDIMSRIETLSDYPLSGTLEPSFNYQGMELRVLHGRHVRVYYTIKEKEILIVLLWDHRRDDRLIASAIQSAQ